jgi:hypothetical protein
MPIIKVQRYTAKDLRENPEARYVFGDNMKRVGHGGQAAVCRDQPNAIGIPTLWAPGKVFCDDDFDKVKDTIRGDFISCMKALIDKRILVWPSDGIGTGFAQLPSSSPEIWNFVQRLRRDLFLVGGWFTSKSDTVVEATLKKYAKYW